jgi:predicted acetyltransferase
MSIEIRPPGEDELRAAMDAAEIAFGSAGVEDEDWERERKALPADRAIAAFDGGKPVALAGAYEFDLTIPGGQLPCAGVTWVGVMPTHRRRGILRDFMRQQLADVKRWGEPLAALWASEASIYGRFGYGHGAANLHMKSNTARFRLRAEPASNARVRFVDADEAYALFPPVYERVRSRRPGMLTRDERWWKEHRLADPESWRRGASKKLFVVLEVDSAPEAYAYYRVKDDWADGFSKSEVRVVEAIATTPEAERALWKFLHELDLTIVVDAAIFDPGSPLPLAVRDPRALNLRWGDGLWLRLVDVEAALQARSYHPGSSVVLEVRDELCDWNNGRYRVGDDAGRTDAEADLVLDVADLASAYLGQFDFNRLVAAGLADERFDGAADAASALFRTARPPFCPEVF